MSQGVSGGHQTSPEVIVSPGMKFIKTCWHFIFHACFAGQGGGGGERERRGGGVQDDADSLVQVCMKI